MEQIQHKARKFYGKNRPQLSPLYPENFESKIQFNEIRTLLKQHCICSLGENEVDNMRFSNNFSKINEQISITDEIVRLITLDSEELPLENFYDIRSTLSRVKVEGLYFDENELFNLNRSISAVTRLIKYILQHEESQFPFLHKSIKGIASFQDISKKIDAILDKFGKIKDNATPELAHIRREIIKAQSSASRTLIKILREAQEAGYAEKDLAPTMREGRLVIPVSPSYKRKINGIVHDESATGKTVYIEPQQVVESNNRVRELESEEKREITKILLSITNYIRPYVEEILDSQYFLGKMDFIHAKAQFALVTNSIKPRLENIQQVEWKKAIHPLLFLTLKKQNKTVIPLDISLNNNQRILIISGPNAGGKSVCLKTVVIIQYMLQCGMLVPLHDSSNMGLFNQLFIDIGDEQSIENDLSTYSSHLLNLKYFVKNSNSKTLLLIDEFGTGTEPQIGGAIAESALERLNQNKSFGVITTHYTNLKLYAEDAEGVINGAMLYDRQHLQPLFQLEIGNPGSSFAVEIARKIGLPEDLIQEAANKVGQEHLDYDKYLQDIVRDKKYWERKRQEVHQKEKKLEEKFSVYEMQLENINKLKKEITLNAKAQAETLLKEANAKIENTIRQIKEANAEKEKTKEIREELKNFRENLDKSDEKPQLNLKLKVKPKNKQEKKKTAPDNNFQVGDQVRINGHDSVGNIASIDEKQAVIYFGQIKSTVPLSKLEKVSNNQLKKENKYAKFGQTSSDEVRKRKLNFKADIDVRGMRGDEALQAVTYFIDDALMVEVGSVRILHGTGTGALRQQIREYLNTVPGVKNFHDEHVQFGGSGITIVEF